MSRWRVAATGAAMAALITLAGCRSDDATEGMAPAAGASSSTTPAAGARAEAESDIRADFATYREALLAGDGPTALAYVTAETVAYFADMAALGARGGPEEIAGRSTGDRFFVTLVRQQVPRDELARMSGEELFVYGVEKGLIGAETVAALELGGIQLGARSALAEVLTDGRPGGAAYRFLEEDGTWKVDLVDQLRGVEDIVTRAAAERGQSEDEYIFDVVAETTGRPVPADIWARPGA